MLKAAIFWRGMDGWFLAILLHWTRWNRQQIATVVVAAADFAISCLELNPASFFFTDSTERTTIHLQGKLTWKQFSLWRLLCFFIAGSILRIFSLSERKRSNKIISFLGIILLRWKQRSLKRSSLLWCCLILDFVLRFLWLHGEQLLGFQSWSLSLRRNFSVTAFNYLVLEAADERAFSSWFMEMREYRTLFLCETMDFIRSFFSSSMSSRAWRRRLIRIIRISLFRGMIHNEKTLKTSVAYLQKWKSVTFLLIFKLACLFPFFEDFSAQSAQSEFLIVETR